MNVHKVLTVTTDRIVVNWLVRLQRGRRKRRKREGAGGARSFEVGLDDDGDESEGAGPPRRRLRRARAVESEEEEDAPLNFQCRATNCKVCTHKIPLPPRSENSNPYLDP